MLLENGAQVDDNRCTPLSRAIDTPLSRAIEGGNVGVVELLLAQGVEVNYQYIIVSKFDRSTELIADIVLLYYCRK